MVGIGSRLPFKSWSKYKKYWVPNTISSRRIARGLEVMNRQVLKVMRSLLRERKQRIEYGPQLLYLCQSMLNQLRSSILGGIAPVIFFNGLPRQDSIIVLYQPPQEGIFCRVRNKALMTRSRSILRRCKLRWTACINECPPWQRRKTTLGYVDTAKNTACLR